MTAPPVPEPVQAPPEAAAEPHGHMEIRPRELEDSQQTFRDIDAASEPTISEGSWRNSEEEVNVNLLIENEVSQALQKHASFCHSDAGVFDFERFVFNMDAGVPRPGSERFRPSEASLVSCGSWAKMSSNDMMGSVHSQAEEHEREKDLLRHLFGPQENGAHTHEKHRALGRVITNIFTELRMDEGMMNRSSWSVSRYYVGAETIGARARKLASHPLFIGFFLLVTLYALFAPDMVRAWGTKENELNFQIVSTIVFFLFALEIFISILDDRPYIFTVMFLLDSLALFSFLTDTWFFHKDPNVLEDKTSVIAQIVRSTRLTRLARIARIARMTRIMPAVVTLCLRHKVRLARVMILRRIWRAFVFIDVDRDRLVTFYDLKFFYVSVLYRFQLTVPVYPHLLADTRFLLDAESNGNITHLDFGEFSRLFMATLLGKDLMRLQLADMERTAGVWMLIRKVSDRSALKLSVGVLLLFGILQACSLDQDDVSARQDLKQLEFLSRDASLALAAGSEQLCEHVTLYAQTHGLLLMVLHGRLVWEKGQCLWGAASPLVSPAAVIQMLLETFAASSLRVDEATPLCGSDIPCATASEHTTAVLLDQAQLFRETNAWSVLGTVSTLILLLVYILILNGQITRFSKTLLMPLRALVDDMVALSSLELADMDEELPAEIAGKAQAGEVSEDIQRLQESFKTMRFAVRSWCKYVPPSVVQRLFVAGLEARIGVVKCIATILFCDVDGFEAWCEGLAPAEVLDMLSTVTGTVADVIHKNEGTLLEFIGDEVLAVFNTPRAQKNHTYLGVITALQIHQAMDKLTYRTLKGRKAVNLRCRCGVNTAHIFAGNIGSHQRMKYGLLGDGINLTARMKGLNARYRTRTMVSASVFDAIGVKRRSRHVLIRPVDLVAVKGKKEPSVVYESILSGHLSIKAAYGKHTDGFRLYQQRSFAEAAEAFREASVAIEAAGSTDVPARMLIHRCEGYIANPPPADWDGVERMTKKSFEDPLAQGGLGDIAFRCSAATSTAAVRTTMRPSDVTALRSSSATRTSALTAPLSSATTRCGAVAEHPNVAEHVCDEDERSMADLEVITGQPRISSL